MCRYKSKVIFMDISKIDRNFNAGGNIPVNNLMAQGIIPVLKRILSK